MKWIVLVPLTADSLRPCARRAISFEQPASLRCKLRPGLDDVSKSRYLLIRRSLLEDSLGGSQRLDKVNAYVQPIETYLSPVGPQTSIYLNSVPRFSGLKENIRLLLEHYRLQNLKQTVRNDPSYDLP